MSNNRLGILAHSFSVHSVGKQLPTNTAAICDGQHVKEGNVLFNDALNTFLFTVIRRRREHMKACKNCKEASWLHRLGITNIFEALIPTHFNK